MRSLVFNRIDVTQNRECSGSERVVRNQSSMHRFISKRALALRICLYCLLSLLPITAAAEPGIVLLDEQSYPDGGFDLREMDLWIQAKGTPLRYTRTYSPATGWEWNRRWQNLKLKQDEERILKGSGRSGSVSVKLDPDDPDDPDEPVTGHFDEWDYLVREDTEYEKVPGQARFGFLGIHIEATQEGYTWKNRRGDWIKYDQNGVTLSYGDSEGNTYTLIRDSKGRIASLEDKLDRTLLTVSYAYPDGEQPATVTDYAGRRVRYHYDGDRRLVRVTDVLEHDWRYEYREGYLVRRIDAELKATTYNYEEDRVVEIVYPDGFSKVFEFDYERESSGEYYRFTVVGEDGTVAEQKIWNGDPERMSMRVSFPQAANSIRFKLSTGSSDEKEILSRRLNGEVVERVVYNWKTKTRRVTDQFGKVTVIEEDQWGNPLKATYPDGGIEEQTFHSQYNYPTHFVDRAGTEFNYTYDSAGRLTSVTEAVGTPVARSINFVHTEDSTRATFSGPDAATFSRYSYFDDRGNLIKWREGEGYETTYTHDVMGNITSLTTPRGYTYTYTYDDAGNLLSEADPWERVTSYAYDRVGNLITETAPNQSQTTFGYNDLDQWTDIKNHLGQQSSLDYNNRTRSMIGASDGNELTREQFDYLGMPLSTEDAEGNRIRYGYENYLLKEVNYPTYRQTFERDSRNLISAIATHFDGQVRTQKFEYDILGRLTKIIDHDNSTAEYTYDRLGRVTEILDADNQTTYFYWDHLDNLIRVVDPENRTTYFEYDNNGYVTAEVIMVDGVESRREYAYDGNGNLTNVRMPTGGELVYTYDKADQLTLLQRFQSTGDTDPERSVSFSYNKLGLLESYDNGDTSAVFAYTDLGQLESVTTDYGPFEKTIGYQYDNNGKVSSYTSPEGNTYSYTYDDAGRASTVAIPGVGTIGIGDYKWTQPQTISLPGGAKIQRSYNDVMYMTENRLLDPTQSELKNSVYEYDDEWNLSLITTEEGSYRFGYDQLDRLDSAQYPDGLEESFSYDGVGNRTRHRVNAPGQAAQDTNLQYDSNNRLTNRGDETFYQYDANGNQTSYGTSPGGLNPDRRFIYDTAQRLIRVEGPAGEAIASYGYGPSGQRLWKEVNGNRTYFLYSLGGLAAEYDAAGNLLREYHYLPDSLWMTNPLFMRSGGGTYFYQNDLFGRPSALARRNGELVWEATYGAFGKAEVVKEGVTSNLRLPGQYFDAETGLHYNFARYYNPSTGRYIQADPVGLAGGLNRYAYARLSPYMAVDINGRNWQEYSPTRPYTRGPEFFPIPDRIPTPFDSLSPEQISLIVGIADGMLGISPDTSSEFLQSIDVEVDRCSAGYRVGRLIGMFHPGSRVGRGVGQGLKQLKRVKWLKNKKFIGGGTRNRTRSPCRCFVEGTLVQTETGPVAIEDIEVGDLVWAKHDVTGDMALKPVLALHQTDEKPVVEVTLRDSEGNEESLVVSPDHPFWLEGESWTRSERLEPGNLVETRQGLSLEVVSVELQEAKRPTFNFVVDEYHSYFAGSYGAWVHNGCKDRVKNKVDPNQIGSYTNTHASGKTYVGKGSRKRSQKSGRREARRNGDPHIATDWTPAKSHREGFKQESRRLDAEGGPRSPNNYNRIEQPGKKYRQQDGEL